MLFSKESKLWKTKTHLKSLRWREARKLKWHTREIEYKKENDITESEKNADFIGDDLERSFRTPYDMTQDMFPLKQCYKSYRKEISLKSKISKI